MKAKGFFFCKSRIFSRVANFWFELIKIKLPNYESWNEERKGNM
jgi:hypothetical protein